jgi:tetratricopeptide (TPR) repeat protein
LKKSAAYIALSLLAMLLLAAGCSVQKNTALSRTFHNITAKYNVLFNGNESFKKGAAKIDANFQDDYAEILPVFPFAEKSAAALCAADMDRAIKKCTKLISMHSITVKPKVKNAKNLTEKEREFFNKKEYNAFVDDAYLLMAKSHVYKLEYVQAAEVLHSLINDYKNQPVVPEAQLWLSRTDIETGQYKDAYELLNMLQNKTDLPPRVTAELYPTLAQYYLKQKDYAKAITYLEKGIPLTKRKRTRTRYTFILAQLYEKTGDLKRASDTYQQVIHLNPPYTMAFNARINRALAFQQGFGKADEIGSELSKMLRDDKNKEYLDQIYYALGNLAAKEGDYPKAAEQYRKSLDASVNNEQQKTRSYLTLANLYYSLPDYPNAQAYYDSALLQLQPDYPGYEALYTKSKSLTRLVTELNTATLEDSVLKLAKLPQAELFAKIDGLIDAERKKDEELRKKQLDAQLDQQFGNEVAVQNFSKQQRSTEGTRWYFYNEAAKSLGYREFRLTWGSRKLEDNWQRAVKAAATFGTTGTDEAEQAEEDQKPANNLSRMSRDYYLVNVPRTDSAVTESLKRLESALFNMGVIYKNELKDYDKSAAAFRDLIKRFPDSEYLLSSYYNLYLMARDQNNTSMAASYKDLIASRFPESTYARILTNPNYVKELEAEEQKITRYYTDTYSLYTAGKYAEVVPRADYALKTFTGHSLLPKFAYLGTLSGGKSQDRAAFRESLKTLVTRYPGTDVAEDANNLIRYMDQEHPEIREAVDLVASREMFRPEPDAEHVFGYVTDKKSNVNQLVFNIINFNLDNFDKLSLRVDITEWSTTENLIVVKPFRNGKAATDYLAAITAFEDIRKDIPEIRITPLVISTGNLNRVKTEKSSDLYLKFYKENYPQ